MTSRSYFGKMNSTLGSVVPLAMFLFLPQHESDSTCRGDVGDPGPEGLIGAKGEPGRDGLPGVSNIISCQLPI